MRTVEAWLWALCMPDGVAAAGSLPRRRLLPGEWGELCRQADLHGVLPAVERNVRGLLATRGAEIAATTEERRSCETVLEAASRRGAERAAITAALRNRGERIVGAL